MPPLHSGDTGDGHGEDDDGLDGLDDVGFRPPLPPDDRLWRHPSEVAVQRAPGAGDEPAQRRRPLWASRTAALVVLAGVTGATLAVGAVAALGVFEPDERVVEQRVAVAPASSAALETDSVAAVAARTAPAVAALSVLGSDGTSAGSAVVFRSDGYLLTNAHLVEGATRIDVMFHDGPAERADVVGDDPLTGIAVLHVDRNDLQSAAFGSADGLVVGARAIAIGAIADNGWDTAVSTGVISATGRRLQAADGTVLHDMILIDAPLAAGGAGGALVDGRGAVVGITSAVAAGSDGRFGVATPVDVAELVATQIIQSGHATHVWLGIQGSDLGAAGATEHGLAGAAEVDQVVAGGPAEAAGVLAGDLVVGVDDRSVSSMSDLIAALRRHLPGDEIVLHVWRDGQTLPLTVVLAPRTDGR